MKARHYDIFCLISRLSFVDVEGEVIQVPGMGDSITEGEIGSWLVCTSVFQQCCLLFYHQIIALLDYLLLLSFKMFSLLAMRSLTGVDVAEGEHVEEDALVCEIETDKISVEIRAPYAGTVTKFYAQVRVQSSAAILQLLNFVNFVFFLAQHVKIVC